MTTTWKDGWPDKPGWYLFQYRGGHIEAVHIGPHSVLLTTCDPELFGIVRHFEFTV